MGRLKGSRNHDYEARRHELAMSLAGALVDDRGHPRPVKDLAARVGVAVPTLLHYFEDHDGMVRASFQAVAAEGAARLQLLDDLVRRPAPEALRRFALNLAQAFRNFGLGRIFSSGLVLGLGHPSLGPEFLRSILEPSLDHAERLAAALIERGELQVRDVRAFAISFVSPLVLALLHQDALGGRHERALDLDEFIDAHVATVLDGAGGKRRKK